MTTINPDKTQPIHVQRQKHSWHQQASLLCKQRSKSQPWHSLPHRTWLTPDIPDDALFLPSFVIYRKDRCSNNNNNKHGGALMAVQNHINSSIFNLKSNAEFNIVNINTVTGSVLISCIHNPPENSFYRLPLNSLKTFLEKIKKQSVNALVIT